MAFDEIEPLPQPWLMVGLICSVLANLAPVKKKKKSFKPEDFMPMVPLAPSEHDQKAAMIFAKSMADAMNRAKQKQAARRQARREERAARKTEKENKKNK